MDVISKSFRGYVGYSSMVMAQRLRELGGHGSVLRRDVPSEPTILLEKEQESMQAWAE